MKVRLSACFNATIDVTDAICPSEAESIAREVLEEVIEDLDAQETRVHRDYFVQIQGVNNVTLELI